MSTSSVIHNAKHGGGKHSRGYECFFRLENISLAQQIHLLFSLPYGNSSDQRFSLRK